MLSVVRGIQPRQVEAILAAQMAAAHMASTTFAGRIMRARRRPVRLIGLA
jgi:hypothetical protein